MAQRNAGAESLQVLLRAHAARGIGRRADLHRAGGRGRSLGALNLHKCVRDRCVSTCAPRSISPPPCPSCQRTQPAKHPSTTAQPRTTEQNQAKPITIKHNQAQPGKQVEPGTRRRKQAELDTAKHNQTQPGTKEATPPFVLRVPCLWLWFGCRCGCVCASCGCGYKQHSNTSGADASPARSQHVCHSLPSSDQANARFFQG